MLVSEKVADVLGLHGNVSSPLRLLSRIEDGLPVDALERIAALLAPGDALFKYRVVPKATFERRKGSGRLSADEGVRVARLARIWSLATDVWGDDSQARDFLFRPHPMLDDERPVDLAIRGEIGAEMVLDVLGGLKYGSAA